jgi:hypothetical protein
MSDISIQSVLRAEYALLCIGDFFKKEFDNFAEEHNITTIPSAYQVSTDTLHLIRYSWQ